MGNSKTLNRIVVPLCTAILALALLICTPGAFAAPEDAKEAANLQKSEAVYGMLNPDGSVRETYVVNRFTSAGPGHATDFGSYTTVDNLSTTQELTCDDGQVSFDKDDGPFFYQGTLEKAQLPWIVDIAYTLDGHPIEPENLAGSTGLLGITVNTKANSPVDPAFYESFVLQVTFTLDGDLCSDIKAKDATVATSGKDHTVAFTALPGREGSFELSAQVHDFEMASAQIAALPYSSIIEMPDTSEMESGLDDLSDAVSQLNAGTDKLADGAERLSSGADSLADGASEFGDGLDKLASSSDQIVKASAQIDGVLKQIAGTLEKTDFSNIDDLSAYSPMLRELAETLGALRTVVNELDGGYARMAQVLDTLAGVVKANALSDAEIAALRAEVADNEEAAAALERLLATYDAVQAAVDEYYASGGSPATIEAQLEPFFADGGELDKAVQALTTAADFLEKDNIDQIKQLVTGLTELSSEYSKFHSGLVQYTDGVKQLNENYGTLSAGISELAGGTSQLASGANRLSHGVAELDKATSDLPAQMRERMGELMEDYEFPEFNPISFVDKRNQNVTAVQFVLLTDAIEKPEPEAPAPEPEPEPSIWDRFLDLFGF